MSTAITQIVDVTKTERVVVQDKAPTVIVTGIMGPPGRSSLAASTDIDLNDLQTLGDGALLVYNAATQKWTASKTLEQVTVNAGFF